MKTKVHYIKLSKKYKGVRVYDEEGKEYPYELVDGEDLHIKLPTFIEGSRIRVSDGENKSDPKEVWSEYEIVVHGNQ